VFSSVRQGTFRSMLTDAIFVCAPCYAFHTAAIGIATAEQKQKQSNGKAAAATTRR